MKLYVIVIIALVFVGCQKGPDKYVEFGFGEQVLIYEPDYHSNKGEKKLYVGIYNRSFEMKLLDPKTKTPFTGTIITDKNDPMMGEFEIVDGYMENIKVDYRNGSPSFHGAFNQGKVINTKRWFEDGTLSSETIGGEHWSHISFFENGSVNYKIENGVKIEYYSSGKVKVEIPFNEEDDFHEYHGTVIAYNEDGSKKGEIVYKNGVLISKIEL